MISLIVSIILFFVLVTVVVANFISKKIPKSKLKEIKEELKTGEWKFSGGDSYPFIAKGKWAVVRKFVWEHDKLLGTSWMVQFYYRRLLRQYKNKRLSKTVCPRCNSTCIYLLDAANRTWITFCKDCCYLGPVNKVNGE